MAEMIDAAGLAEIVRRALPPDVLGRSGTVLFSGAKTLCRGDIYILGLNPAGDANKLSGNTIDASLNELCAREFNEYVDGCWGNKGAGNGKIQTRIRWLIQALGHDILSVCASNLIFRRTKSAEQLDFPDEAHECWPVHRAIIETVRPKMILSNGTGPRSAYTYLRRFIASDIASEGRFASGHGNQMCKHFDMILDGLTIKVVGIPHLSRYKVTGKEAVAHRCKELLSG